MAKQEQVNKAMSEIVGGVKAPKAEQPQGEYNDLDAGRIQATGVGLREGELAALAAIGEELGDYLDADPVSRNALMRIAIRTFIVSYRDGTLSPAELAAYFERPEKPKPKLGF